MSRVPNQVLEQTAFGELSVSEPTPTTQLIAINGLTDKTQEFAFLGGTATAVDSEFTAATGITAGAFGAILSSKNISYRAGQGAVCKISAHFSQVGVASSLMQAGFISSTDSLAFVIRDGVFGVERRHDGRVEIQELQVTSATTGAGDVTVTVDGTPYTVPVTIATVQVNALEISNSLNSQVPNYSFTSNDDTVTAASDIAEPMDAFAFALDTATGTAATWTQIEPGVLSQVQTIAQADWDPGLSFTVDPIMGNVYMVKFQYLGYGAMSFFVENPTTGCFDLAHRINYANANTTPSLGDPSMTVGWTASSQGSTTDINVSGASGGLFVEGKNIDTERPRALTNTLLAVGTTPTNLITIRNRIVRGDRGNRISTDVLEVSGLTDSAKGALVDIIIGATVAGDPDFQYVDKAESNTEYDIVGTTVTGGTSIATLDIIAGSSNSIDLKKLMTTLEPDQTLTLAASVVAAPASDITATINFQEDI